ncbi:MAG: HAD family hydrolase [Bacteroidota bacterium]
MVKDRKTIPISKLYPTFRDLVQKPKAIIFDVGNTLLEEVSYDLDKGLAQTLKELKIYAKDECFNNPTYLKQIIKDFYTGNHNEFVLIDWLKKTLADSEITLTIEKLEYIVWNNTVTLKPYPDIDIILNQLKQRGIRLAAISNTVFTSNVMKHEFLKHQLLDYFDFIITSADLGIRKPAKQIFFQAIDTIKLHPSDIWFVGDNWEDDIMGADAVGLKAIWKCENGKPDNGHLYFHDWQDFFRKFIRNQSWV